MTRESAFCPLPLGSSAKGKSDGLRVFHPHLSDKWYSGEQSESHGGKLRSSCPSGLDVGNSQSYPHGGVWGDSRKSERAVRTKATGS